MKTTSSDFMERVEEGKIEITADDLPSFLYESETVYDPDNETTGLFRGFLLVRVCIYFLDLLPINSCFQVYCHLFTGPTSALGQREHGQNKNKAGIFELKAVTGRTIAYVCVQVYCSLFF